jgi:hypothetical protein
MVCIFEEKPRLSSSGPQKNLIHMQGDQIGRMFAHCAIDYLRLCFKSTEEALLFGLLFSRSESYASIFTEHGLGHVLGDFFTNSSGHPVHMECPYMRL